MISTPSSSSASLRRPFTVACVPTGRKNGVSTVPWGVVKRPRRAPDGSVFATSKEKFIFDQAPERLDKQVCPPYFSLSGEDEGPAHAEHNIDCLNREGNGERLGAL